MSILDVSGNPLIYYYFILCIISHKFLDYCIFRLSGINVFMSIVFIFTSLINLP